MAAARGGNGHSAIVVGEEIRVPPYITYLQGADKS